MNLLLLFYYLNAASALPAFHDENDKVIDENCQINENSKRVSNCQIGFECKTTKRLKIFESSKCVKVSKKFEQCDLIGENPHLGVCEEGLECAEFLNSGSAEQGVCLDPINWKKDGEPCDVLGVDATLGFCQEGFECVVVDENPFAPGICKKTIRTKRLGEPCDIIEQSEKSEVPLSDCKEGLKCVFSIANGWMRRRCALID